MTGDEDGNSVGAVGLCDGAEGCGFADVLREFTVGDGLAVGDGEEGLPDRDLEGCAIEFERGLKGLEFALEIEVEFVFDLIGDRRAGRRCFFKG